MRKAFTLIEVTVAVALLVVIMAMAGVVFRVGIESHRLALANAEIIRKFRTITDQLDADLKGLCKDGEIFIVWDANEKGIHTGLDRIMFFSKGDFYAYGSNNMGLRGNLARISYMLTMPEDIDPNLAGPTQRVLTRTQHILTADDGLDEFGPLTAEPNDPNDTASDEDWQDWHNKWEHDRLTLEQWREMPNNKAKFNALSLILDVGVGEPTVLDRDVWGVHVSRNDPNTIQNILCEAIGTFRIQSWYDPFQSWMPDDDPDNDPDTQDTDYIIQEVRAEDEEKEVSGVLYSNLKTDSGQNLGGVRLNLDGRFAGEDLRATIDEDRFNEIPGLGQAWKFTFTLYDSRGLIPGGRTFTHIVYLDR